VLAVRRAGWRIATGDSPTDKEAIVAEYLILIYEQETDLTEAEFNELMGQHNAFPEQVGALGGRLIGGNALQPTATATSIRTDVVTDGPFVETKEALGGYYLIDAPDLDTALAIGKVCPAPRGGVEVRPIWNFDE
jgi:hypothetical protein